MNMLLSTVTVRSVSSGTAERQLLEQAFPARRMEPARADIFQHAGYLGRDHRRRDRVASRRPGTFSVSISATYWRVSAFSGSVEMRMKSSRVSACSSTRIGKRPWNSGIEMEA